MSSSAATPQPDKRARVGFGIANVVLSIAMVAGVFRLLPTRWWVVDTGAVVMGLLLFASGVALLRDMSVAAKLTRVAASVVLVLGLALFAALALTASWISGVYGQVGAGGGVVFGLVAALVLPYVVVLPAVELAWVYPRPPEKKSTAKASKADDDA